MSRTGTPVSALCRLFGATRILTVCALAWSASASATIAYVQGAYTTPDTPQSTVTAAYGGAQTAGDLNVVVVGWNDTTHNVSSVSDSSGNTYSLAVGPTVSAGNATQLIYYAKNIAAAAAGANTVTVTFDGAANYPDVRIAEYSGIDTVSPLDVAVGADGVGTTISSGSASTSNANDLLVGANYVEHGTDAPGSGYTQRLYTADSSILEDRVVTTTGSYDASATLYASSWWVMQMAAFKAASGGDTEAPTPPTGLTATVASSSQIDLSWTASTDNVGVANYRVERCQGSGCSSFTEIATPTGTTYSDTGLTASTSYSYRVRAADAVPNLSGYSNTASATTQAPPDTQAPTPPSNLTASAASSSQIDLTWTASTDNVGVVNYRVERCQGAGCSSFTEIATPTGTTYSDTGLTASTSYSYRVRAADAVPNLSGYSNTASATTQAPPDTQAPTPPSNLTASATSSSQINLTWTASTDNVGVVNYRVERCQGAGCSSFTQIATPTGTSYSDTGLSASTTYSYRIRAADAVPNLSDYSNTASATTQVPPTAPSNLVVVAASSNEIDLAWTASTSGQGITGYLIERCQGASCSNFAQIGSSSGTTYNDAGRSASTSYRYRVRATDAAGNLSAYSNTTTQSTAASSPDCN